MAEGVLAAALGRGVMPGAVSVTAVAPETIAAPQFQPRRSTQATSGNCATQDAKPTTRHNRPMEMLRKARTTTGSNWLPEHLTSSCRAAETLTGFRYGRTAVITSEEAATATVRHPSELCSPASPSGCPVPS